ncbi:hypothetical protein MKK69_22050 [Methylobacterium sp. J-026]|uniref:hypothetical protein n=1 Tax=Methylobacterium sp. J-026 TaxID=2836624 RepID=UPI001FBB6BA7|nr:hypothetical protein [Methylobacterium sp. J-026]MCJ2136698.1 hypothetical protein [Methylobacterium sp. J-026]
MRGGKLDRILCVRPSPGSPKMTTPQSFKMTSGARILRGSKRIGAFLGGIAFLSGAALSIGSAYDTATYTASTYAQARCLSQKTGATLIANQYGSAAPEYVYESNGCPGRAYEATEAEVRTILAKGAPAFGPTIVSETYPGLMASTLAAVVIFGLCWGLGWVGAGFTAD